MNRARARTILLGLGSPVSEDVRAAAIGAVIDELCGENAEVMRSAYDETMAAYRVASAAADRFRRGLVAALGRNPNEPGTVPGDEALIDEVAAELEQLLELRATKPADDAARTAAVDLARWYDGPHPGEEPATHQDAWRALDRFRRDCGIPRPNQQEGEPDVG